jgi:hypothetical protein
MIIVLIAVGVLGVACGMWLGYAIAIRQTREEYADVLERLDPPARTPGQPTNIDAPAARVTEAKRRPGHFMS